MFKGSSVFLSRPQRQHFRKKIPGYYSAFYGASFMKFRPIIPYSRQGDSLIQYPDISSVTGKKISWMYDTPKSGFEAIKVYGENTIEVKGLPMGFTPEYMQERLRRYFAKFGPVVVCRALNHPLDPYQCEGTAFISFREIYPAQAALKSVIRLAPRMDNRVLSVRLLATDEVHDGSETIKSRQDEIESLVLSVSKLHESMRDRSEGTPLLDLTEHIQSRLTSDLSSLFTVSSDKLVFARRLVDVSRALSVFRQKLRNELEESLTVHWRAHAAIQDLPEYTKRRIQLWDKKDKLPFDLQILSRDHRQYKIHDEKFMVEAKRKRERARNRAENRRAAIAARRGNEQLEAE
jgi:hypothetical protein